MGLETNSESVTGLNAGEGGMGFVPIAICGMACRLPGGVHSPEDLWDFLMSKGDARSIVPKSRYNVSGYHSNRQTPGSVISQYGYFLDEDCDLGALDTSVFPMARREIERMDPQQRLLLEVARESLDDSGEVGWRGKNIGVYVGSFGNDWYDLSLADSHKYGPYRVGTTHDFALSNRLSYEMDLRGPSMTIRTACSSSLIALNEACTSIARGESESAIVGGTNIIMAPSLTAAISEEGALSVDGSCKTFSSAANGYARGEGVVVFHLKSLEHARRDGNFIHAVIVGSATNCDGKTPGFSIPNSAAQEALIWQTYKLAAIPRDEVLKTAYFECHGTGTSVGDPIEAAAVAKVFEESDGVYIGSVKPNLGHGEGASGLTSLLKAVLALKHRTIPPTIKCLPLNPKIPIESGPLRLPIEATPWPQDRYERVSVNSFGIGGANVHVVVDSAARFSENPRDTVTTKVADPETPQLLLYSAKSIQSLEEMTKRWSEFLDKAPEDMLLADVAYTLANRREQLPFRSFSVGSRLNPSIASPPMAPRVAPSLVMVFTGQGSQWPQMGRELLESNKVFRNSLQGLNRHLKALDSDAPDWTIEEELLKPTRGSRINTAEFSQPLCTALQIALVDTFASIGVRPAAVVGHSSGEIAAAYAAGGLTAEEAITVAFYRGLVSKEQTRPGKMAAVSLSRTDVEKYLLPRVIVACENSPGNVTLSGDADQLELTVAAIKDSSPNAFSSVLRVDKAYHSYHMKEVGEKYCSLMSASHVKGSATTIPFFSSVTGQLLPTDSCGNGLGPRYWQQNLESPVLFSSAVSSILDGVQFPAFHNPVFVEVGPHGALSAPLRQIIAEKGPKSIPLLSTLTRRENSQASLLKAVGRLWSLHVDIDFSVLIPRGSCLPDLPRYPWNHQDRFWDETRVAKAWRLREYPYHNLLGARVLESSDVEPVWRNILQLNNVPWISDHKIKGDIIFPFAGYVSIAAEAVQQVTKVQGPVELEHVVVTTSLVLTDDEPKELITNFHRHRLTDTVDSQWWEFTILSLNGNSWIKHCFGKVRMATREAWPVDGKFLPEVNLPHKVNMPRWYERVRRAGLEYGPSFRAVEQMNTSSTGPVGMSHGIPRNDRHQDENDYLIHPIVLDTCFQLLGAAANHGITNAYTQYIPLSVEHMVFGNCAVDTIEISTYCETTGDGIRGDVRCVNGLSTVLKISGVSMTSLNRGENPILETDFPITAKQEWVQHVDFAHIKTLFKPTHDTSYMPNLEDMGQTAILLSKRLLSGIDMVGKDPAMQTYKGWLSTRIFPSLDSMASCELEARMKLLAESLAETHAAPAAKAITEAYAATLASASCGAAAFDSFHKGQILVGFERFLRDFDASGFLHCLALGKADLRVLELGTGLGPQGQGLWNHMKINGQRLYSKYVYTEASPAWASAAGGRFGTEEPSVVFQTLDISQDPDDQGFAEREFDLIIVDGLMHPTHYSSTSLGNIRKLLNADGKLLLHQLRRGDAWVEYVLATVPEGRCSGGFDDKTPLSSLTRLADELTTAGFDTMESITEETSPNMILIARSRHETTSLDRITILHRSNKLAASSRLSRRLEAEGIKVDHCTIDEALFAEKNRDMISMLDDGSPFLEGLDPIDFERFKTLLERLASSGCGMLWITCPSQVYCQNPQYAPSIGLARTLRLEIDAKFATYETDDIDSPAGIGSVVKVLHRFYDQRARGVADIDFEYAYSEGSILVNRFFPFPLANELPDLELTESSLSISQPGRLNSLKWVSLEVQTPQTDSIEVEVYAVGVNFRDVMVVMGILEAQTRQPDLGSEATGVVRRVGRDVTDFRAGDRVIFVNTQTFSTTTTVSKRNCAKLPDSVSFIDGASMPVAFMTAIQSLIKVARLESHQSVLIHSGCGGVGIASIQVARMIGAEIYTTVSSNEKAAYLTETFGIPKNHIFDSRSTSFVEALLRETNGRGVDVALNSLSGELLHATWRCVAKFGTLVEIGKKDLLGNSRLDMAPFLENRSYCCVDLRQLLQERPHTAGGLLHLVMSYSQRGLIQSIPIARVYPASAIIDAFLYMQRGSHIGKIVASLRDESTRETQIREFVHVSRDAGALFNADASYLLVGGLGGLGQSIAIWMAQRGARHLTFLSRRAGDRKEDQNMLRMLESLGCGVQFVRCSVTSAVDVGRAIDGLPAPLKGILQLSMVLRDQAFSRMTMTDWKEAIEPKIQGTWNLHHASKERGLDLDFFFLMSSLSGILGQTGQANYAAANTFLDAFAKYRTALGLPCSAIALGATEGIGYLSENVDLLRKMRGSGWRLITEEELLAAMSIALRRPSIPKRQDGQSRLLEAQLWTAAYQSTSNMLLGLAPVAALGNPSSSARLLRDVRMAMYRGQKEGSGGDGALNNGEANTLRAFLARARAEPALFREPETAVVFARETGKKLFSILLKPEEEPNITSALAEIGLDSMIAVEMRMWWKLEFGLNISVLEMLAMGTLSALGQRAAKELAAMYT
ncbi:hypothetical protein F4861DRAFT_551811 [Xylaria intraflava]|nr:hypothetical protein F4861DRAFT_551811 [Xylaria intraflava]